MHIKRLSEILWDIPILVPGVGAQGGDLETIMTYFKDRAIINVGRSILYASNKRNDLQIKINEYINNYYKTINRFIND